MVSASRKRISYNRDPFSEFVLANLWQKVKTCNIKYPKCSSSKASYFVTSPTRAFLTPFQLFPIVSIPFQHCLPPSLQLICSLVYYLYLVRKWTWVHCSWLAEHSESNKQMCRSRAQGKGPGWRKHGNLLGNWVNHQWEAGRAWRRGLRISTLEKWGISAGIRQAGKQTARRRGWKLCVDRLRQPGSRLWGV